MLVILRWESSIHTHGSFLQVPNILPPLCRRWCCCRSDRKCRIFDTPHCTIRLWWWWWCWKTFHLFQVDSPHTRDHRNANLLFAPIRLFRSSASSFVFFCFSHTLTRSDLPISVTKSSSRRYFASPEKKCLLSEKKHRAQFLFLHRPVRGGNRFL